MPLYPLAWPVSPRTGRGFVPTQIELNVAGSTRSGGQALSGFEQIVASPAARWEGKFTMPSMLPAELLAWRGFVAALQGRLGTFLLPAFEYGRQPWPQDQFGIAQDPAVVGAGNATITVSLAAAAAANDTRLTLRPTAAGPILAGHRFSIGSSLYEIQQAVTNGDGTVAVSVRPWLRLPAASGAACVFDFPAVSVRLKSDDEGSLRFTSHRSAAPVFAVVEAALT